MFIESIAHAIQEYATQSQYQCIIAGDIEVLRQYCKKRKLFWELPLSIFKKYMPQIKNFDLLNLSLKECADRMHEEGLIELV